MEKLPISVSLVASNEEDRLPRCLESVSDWVSEIVVVINDCTDKTETIAIHYGAKVYEHPWHGFRDQKNIALEYCSQPWILGIDADEEVSLALKEAIFRFFQKDANDYQGAYFPRKVWFLGKWILHGDWYPDYSLRLFKRGLGKWQGSREHDKIYLQGKSKRLSGELYHYSFPTLNKQLMKIIPFSDIFLQRQLDRHAKWSALNAIFRGFWRFFRAYCLKLGFLDGFPGFYIAWFQAFSTFYRYVRLYEYQHKDKQPTKE